MLILKLYGKNIQGALLKKKQKQNVCFVTNKILATPLDSTQQTALKMFLQK